MDRDEGRGRSWTAVVLGGLLIVAGVVLLAAQLAGIDLRAYVGNLGWPAFIIGPGLLLLIAGLLLGEDPGVGLATAGGIVTTVGLLLWYQDATDHWSSWAYAWALVAPTSVGAAMFLWGVLHLRGGIVRAGLSAFTVGALLFLIFFAFFEGVLNIGGDRGLAPYGRQALPIALIVAGVLIVLGRLWPRRRRHADPYGPRESGAPDEPAQPA